jgi:hypothetical protein
MEESMTHPLMQDLAGQVFGLLTVEGFSHYDIWKNHYYKCRCVCGAGCFKRDTELKSGKFFTCGSMTCRFWEKVDKNGPTPQRKPELGPCWVWKNALHTGGYGVLRIPGEKKNARAHVYAWTLENGPVPAGMFVLHHCDNRACVRASHLFVGTHKDNMEDAAEKGRLSSPKPQLSLEQIESILVDVAAGALTYAQIAEKYGTTARTVQRKVTERRHIP